MRNSNLILLLGSLVLLGLPGCAADDGVGSALTNDEASTIVDYVDQEGGGLYLASEYWGFINQSDLNAVNSIANPLGVDFKNTNLDWGQANGEMNFDCFPDPQ